MKFVRSLFFVVAIAIGVGGCGGPPSPSAPQAPKPVCLVLSVGAERGLAHFGTIRALREQGIEPECVVGTSMGAMVGGLYASAPERDPADRYREFTALYVEETKSEAQRNGVVGFLLGAGAVLLSGGAAIPALAVGGAGALAGAGSTSKADVDRFERVLDRYLEGERIETQSIRFATLYQRATKTGVVMEPVLGGVLAEAITDSVSNPLVFPGLDIEEGAHLDPGADRVAAVPLEFACRSFPDHQFIVSNVSERGVFHSSAMTCPFREIRITVPSGIDRAKAITAQDPEFQAVIDVGYEQTLQALDAPMSD